MTWDLAGIAAIITAIVLATTAVTGAMVSAYQRAIAVGKKEALAEQVEKTITAKDAEIAELQAENTQLESWIDALTRPTERQP